MVVCGDLKFIMSVLVEATNAVAHLRLKIVRYWNNTKRQKFMNKCFFNNFKTKNCNLFDRIGSFTSCPNIWRVLFIFDDEVENIASIVSPKIKFQTNKGCIGNDEVFAFRWASRTTSQRTSCNNLKEKKNLNCLYISYYFICISNPNYLNKHNS